MVIDFRALNEKVIGDAYPLPNSTDILDYLGETQYFFVLDLAIGFHQVETHPDYIPETYGHCTKGNAWD